ncbi:aminoglycoside phosphotransferase [Salinisphaera orenii MK-B5]|uniref:Aminoglycoside phosphotransferase n=2 Tax=Salinisphaera orenii TaxID=856731 RepID=A0A423PVR0_9GAMM|nr:MULTISPECIES: phosphotransferase [Salinisphaera]ROO24790.1 aminoglycoside phosphotransferase [Salinisphaera halophila YIM 95161]ROO29674.1 aminoglycoside phosphotransferase [Salinisphaera orenii MK-B5]
MSGPDDARRRALEAWAGEVLGRTLEWRVASADASFRRYFRGVAADDGEPATIIAMDAPPEREDNAAFVHVAGLMAEAGLNVPRVLAHDAARGFLLLTDLGDRTFLDVLDEDTADALFGAAIGALIDWQVASRPEVLPEYDRATLAAELELFRDWYLARHLRYEPSAVEHADIDAAFSAILDNVCAQPRVFVHRDYMPRNLMVSHPLPGILDFQDARHGPITYDVASLFRDAFVSWPEARIDGWVRHYWDAARGRGLPVGDDWEAFRRDLALMGAQRHLKVLGIFARIAHRDGKPRYLADTPRFVDYLMPVVERFEALAPLAPLLARKVDA